MESYTIYGCDKDADASEAICTSRSHDRAIALAKAVMHYHANVSRLCRTGTGEPFGWFLVVDKDGRIMKAFTMEKPEGFDP